MIRGTHACVLLLLSVSCTEQSERGYFGEWLPDYCRGSRLDALHNDVLVIRTSLRDAYPLLEVQGKRALAECVLCNQPDPKWRVIKVDSSLDRAKTREAIRHEKCHIETYLRTGKAQFHE